MIKYKYANDTSISFAILNGYTSALFSIIKTIKADETFRFM